MYNSFKKGSRPFKLQNITKILQASFTDFCKKLHDSRENIRLGGVVNLLLT